MSISKDDIINFIDGTSNYLLEKIGYLPSHLSEMAKSRQEICDTCSFLSENKKYCTVCGCDYPDLTYAPKKSCDKNNWKAYKSEDK